MLHLLESLRNIRVPSTPAVFLPGRSTPVKNRLHVVHAHASQLDKDGRLIWVEDGWQHNILHTQGEDYILSRAFDTDYGGAPGGWDPSGWTTANTMYVGLDNRATPAEGNTLANLSGEPSGNGYQRQAILVTTGFTIQASGSGYQEAASAATISFSASGGDWTAVQQRFLCTDQSAVLSGTGDLLLATIPLSASRTVKNGDTLNTNIVVGLSE